MSNPQAPETVTRAAESVTLKLTVGASQNAHATPTSGTGLPPFAAVKHLLSDKPLRRPNRTRPLDR
jgi:hypothetical protein